MQKVMLSKKKEKKKNLQY